MTLDEQIDALSAQLRTAEEGVRDLKARRAELVEQKERIVEERRLAAVPPVDRSAHTTIHGTPQGEHLELRPDGMQKDYVVLTADERAKGFVRPLRRSYRHLTCGTVTTMSTPIAETYARDPGFYGGTFCVGCGAHFPVGVDGEFEWHDSTEKVGT